MDRPHTKNTPFMVNGLTISEDNWVTDSASLEKLSTSELFQVVNEIGPTFYETEDHIVRDGRLNKSSSSLITQSFGSSGYRYNDELHVSEHFFYPSKVLFWSQSQGDTQKFDLKEGAEYYPLLKGQVLTREEFKNLFHEKFDKVFGKNLETLDEQEFADILDPKKVIRKFRVIFGVSFPMDHTGNLCGSEAKIDYKIEDSILDAVDLFMKLNMRLNKETDKNVKEELVQRINDESSYFIHKGLSESPSKVLNLDQERLAFKKRIADKLSLANVYGLRAIPNYSLVYQAYGEKKGEIANTLVAKVSTIIEVKANSTISGILESEGEGSHVDKEKMQELRKKYKDSEIKGFNEILLKLMTESCWALCRRFIYTDGMCYHFNLIDVEAMDEIMNKATSDDEIWRFFGGSFLADKGTSASAPNVTRSVVRLPVKCYTQYDAFVTRSQIRKDVAAFMVYDENDWEQDKLFQRLMFKLMAIAGKTLDEYLEEHDEQQFKTSIQSQEADEGSCSSRHACNDGTGKMSEEENCLKKRRLDETTSSERDSPSSESGSVVGAFIGSPKRYVTIGDITSYDFSNRLRDVMFSHVNYVPLIEYIHPIHSPQFQFRSWCQVSPVRSDILRYLDHFELAPPGTDLFFKIKDQFYFDTQSKLNGHVETLPFQLACDLISHEASVMLKLRNSPKAAKYIPKIYATGAIKETSHVFCSLDYPELSGPFLITELIKHERGEHYEYEWLSDERFRKQIIEAFEALHSEGIIHNDVRMENIIKDEDGNAKIIDFEYAYFTDDCDRFDSQMRDVQYMIRSGLDPKGP